MAILLGNSRKKSSGAGGDWRYTHPSHDHPSEPRPLAGDPGVAAKDGAPGICGGSRFQDLGWVTRHRISWWISDLGHPPAGFEVGAVRLAGLTPPMRGETGHEWGIQNEVVGGAPSMQVK